MTTIEIDQEALARKRTLLGGYLSGVGVAAMIATGDRLGLYRAMDGEGPVTSAQLAAKTGLHARWLLEWLRAQAAAGIVDYAGEERFSLSPESATLLADEDSLSFLASSFDAMIDRVGNVAILPEVFRTGRGISWDERGPGAVLGMERGFSVWYRKVLVQAALPAIEGLVPRLEAGALVADVGCGAGIALIEMARAFPRSRFHGYDTSANAIARAIENGGRAGLDNLRFHNAAVERLPEDGSHDLITTFDCVHDMTQPAIVAAAIRAALQDDGYWFIADIDGRGTFEENLAGHPMAANLYSISVLGCLQSGMAEEGGAGMGTLGLPEPEMRALALTAGFSRFERVDLPSPVNAYYVARP